MLFGGADPSGDKHGGSGVRQGEPLICTNRLRRNGAARRFATAAERRGQEPSAGRLARAIMSEDKRSNSEQLAAKKRKDFSGFGGGRPRAYRRTWFFAGTPPFAAFRGQKLNANLR